MIIAFFGSIGCGKTTCSNFLERNYGFFALLSNDVNDPVQALELYRNKDLVEKAFGNLKERLNMRRTTVSSESALEGKLFIQFVALIYLSYLKKQMETADLFRTFTLQGVLDELDVIEAFEEPGFRLRLGEVRWQLRNTFNK